MSTARFEVIGVLDGAGGPTRGTVMIDRATNIFYVRPLGRKTTYSLALGDVATMVCKMLILAEVRNKQQAKRKSRPVTRRRP